MWWWFAVGCVWITAAQQEEALDADGDGVSALVECDDSDPDNDDRPGPVYADEDGDGYGTGEAFRACPGPGRAVADGDCDDTDPAIHPGAVERCDALQVDEDCDGLADDADPEGPVGQVPAFVDADGDGYGAGPAVTACLEGGGFAVIDGDCNDDNPDYRPNAREQCGGGDEDCDGSSDEPGAVGERVYFADSDGDGFGDPVAFVRACTAPAGTVANDLDCDDGTPARNPDRAEACDVALLDEDCDGLVNESDPDTAETWPDEDGDGYGDADAASVSDCSLGTVADDTDCDDNDSQVYPGQGCE